MRLLLVVILTPLVLLAAACSDLTDEDRGESTRGNDNDADIDALRDIVLGTGDVQVTLEWDDEVDLDLWVTDPDGNRIWFGVPSSPTGGQLDVDNRCDGLVPGRPENIFWPEGEAPTGEYIVEIDYFDECDDDGEVDWRIITRVQGEEDEYEGSIEPGDTIEVVEFEVGE